MQSRRNSPLQEAINRLQENSFSSQENREAYLRGLDETVLASVIANESFYDNPNIQAAIQNVKRELGIPATQPPQLPNIPLEVEEPVQGGRRYRGRKTPKRRTHLKRRKTRARRSRKNGSK